MKNQLCFWIPPVMLFTAICAHAQGTTFTYQGRMHDGTNPANGLYDVTCSVWTSAAGPAQVGGSLTNQGIGVTNGLFVLALDFAGGVFDGSPRWLEIAVRTNGGGAFSTLSPRQAVTATPYAIYAGGVNAAGLTGTILATNIGNSTITSNMLAPGAAVANLAAAGATVLSPDPNATNLTAAGYMRLGGPVDLSWEQRPTPSSLAARQSHTAVWTGTEMVVWGGVGTGFPDSGGRYNPATGNWSMVTTNGTPVGRANHTAVWTGTEMIVWGGEGGYRNDGGRYNPATDTWLPVTTTNAPSARAGHRAVWTGTEMIVWGGFSNDE